ncbi:MAG: SDR family NAD(P)-dependent oxidoreductase [Acidobacteriota bacterium]
MKKIDFKDKWIIITGASSGLGKAIAIELAGKEGANLILAARRKDRLESLKKELESEFKIEVMVIETDLSDRESVDNLYKQSTKKADVFGIINNAGMTDYGITEVDKFEKYEKIIDVNLKALMRLSLLFLDYFKKKGEGVLLNVTSMGAFFPLAYQNAYTASKHGAQVFTEILFAENKNKNIIISSYAPGGIATEMLSTSGLDKLRGADDPFNHSADKVAKKAIKSFKKSKLLGIPGFTYSFGLQLRRVLPKKLLLKLMEKSYRKS